MYAVIATGGKQYKVTKGETLRVEKLAGEAGDSVKLDRVLMVADGDKLSVGDPVLDKAAVTAKILSQGRGDKIEIVKFRRRCAGASRSATWTATGCGCARRRASSGPSTGTRRGRSR